MLFLAFFCNFAVLNGYPLGKGSLSTVLGKSKFSSLLPIKQPKFSTALERARKRVVGSGALFLLTPLALYLLASSQFHYSPLNKQAISVRGPFFQGWLVRCVDHSSSLSFVLIVGSFSMRSSRDYTQHYVFLGVNNAGKHQCFHSFPDPSSVTVSEHKDSYLDITWKANNVGYFQFNSTACAGSFTFPYNSSLQFESSSRIPWQPSEKIGFVGPEGWLGLTSLLPCHYFVHSVGSTTSYKLHTPNLGDMEGVGYAHIEGNHGTFFPEGWTWAQAIASNNTASFSLVVGRFVIGPGAPMNSMMFLRRRNGKTAVIRSTDMDRIKYSLDGKERTAYVQGLSLIKGFQVRIAIRTTDDSAHRVFIPTINGFSDQPGCVETYTAVASVVFQEVGMEEEIYEFPLTALEFGGSFIQSVHSNI
ncbi:hypothetical protein EON65_28490 [archaeon]|nr:MAG: hypothetical protein EON65_28490 [archaeon]